MQPNINQSQLAADTVKNYYGFFDNDRDKLANFYVCSYYCFC